MTRFIFATDIHGDQQCPTTIAALHAFTKDFKPDVKICGGDLWDMRPIRRGASPEERGESMRSDWEMGLDFLESWRPGIFLHGNHDTRLDRIAEGGDGLLADYARQAIEERDEACHRLHCEQRPYHKTKGVYKIGDLSFLHGYSHGLYAARQHAINYRHCVVGHLHTFDVSSAGGMDKAVGHLVGSLCCNDMPYNAAHVNTMRQENGWAFGYIQKSGKYSVHFAIKGDGGKFLLPSRIKEY